VEARRSRVPRSGIALATPEAPLTWEGRPRRLRGAIAGTHAHRISVVRGGEGVGSLGVVERGWVACSRSVSRVWTGPQWGLSVIPSLRGAAWSAATETVGRGHSEGATSPGVGVMTSTTRVRPRSWGIMRRGGSGSGCARRAARRRPIR
jgi:hypothetical protein